MSHIAFGWKLGGAFCWFPSLPHFVLLSFSSATLVESAHHKPRETLWSSSSLSSLEFLWVCMVARLVRYITMDKRNNIESMDKLFKPSCWSKRFPTPEQVLSEHITFTKSGKNSDLVSFSLHIWLNNIALVNIYVYIGFWLTIFGFSIFLSIG